MGSAHDKSIVAHVERGPMDTAMKATLSYRRRSLVKEGNSGRIDHGQGNEPRQHTEDLDATPSNIKKNAY